MNTQSIRGFTIVELMLFLAISGLIIAVLLIGWTVTVNTQSYKDSARSLAGVLQQQYNEVANVSNVRADSTSCKLAGDHLVLELDDGSAAPIGASNCVVMGRYIELNEEKLTMSDVVGYQPADAPDSSATDATVIASYHPTKVDADVTSNDYYEIAWSSRPYIGETSSTAHIAIVILRSPLTGTSYTYVKPIQDGDNPSITDIMNSDVDSKGVKICLDPGAPITQGRMAVEIAKDTSSASGVAVLSDSGAACQE